MEWMIVLLCLAMIAGSLAVLRHDREMDESAPKSASKKAVPRCRNRNETEQEQRGREKEAHYMRNFWSYDGSEQQEWDEEG